MGFEIDTDNFARELEKAIEKETELRLGQKNEIPFEELFTEQFMQLYTEFDSIWAFLDESPWTVESQEDFKAIPDDEFDDYVNEHTDFPRWKTMYKTAGKKYMERQLS